MKRESQKNDVAARSASDFVNFNGSPGPVLPQVQHQHSARIDRSERQQFEWQSGQAAAAAGFGHILGQLRAPMRSPEPHASPVAQALSHPRQFDPQCRQAQVAGLGAVAQRSSNLQDPQTV